MPKQQQIKRPVVTLDTSNQLSLFALKGRAAAKDTRAVKPKGVSFNDPDPRCILLNGVCLDEHLRRTGEKSALKVRQLLQEQSWLEFEAAYAPGGRPPYAPRAMTGLILYGIMRGITSLRDLEQFARVDLGCMWVSGGILPDHSIIGRFIQRHADYLTEAFFVSLTRQVLRITGSGTQTVSGDGTVVEAAASRYRVVKEEALQQAVERAQQGVALEPRDEQQVQRLEQLQAAAHVLQTRKAAKKAKGKNADGMQISPGEPEAMIQPLKDKKSFAPSYKPSVLANAVRVIVAQAVDASSEAGVVAGMLEQAGAQGKIETALFDAGYHCNGVLEATGEREIELLCPEGQSQGASWNKQSEKYYPKSRFQYDTQRDSYRCPQGQELIRLSEYKGSEQYPGYVQYGTPACERCEQRSRCTKSVQGRRIKRYAEDAAKELLRDKMEKPEVRERYLKRQGMVEPVFSQLKCRQGLRRFRRKGLKAVRCEFALHAMAYNLSRAMALWAKDIFRVFSWLLHAVVSDEWRGKTHAFSNGRFCKPMPGNFQSILVQL
jgi:transposase